MRWVKVLKHHKTLLVYCSALLISLAVFYALPEYPSVPLNSERPVTMYDLAIEGALEEADWPVVNQSWNFDSLDVGLFLTTADDYLFTTFVVAETAPAGRIIITEYVANSFMAERMTAHQVSLLGTNLKINCPENKINLYYFSPDILTQFSWETQLNPEDEGWYMEVVKLIAPEVLIYIQIPVGMEIKAEEERILSFHQI